MNTNDFSKCRVGDKLWLDPLDCEVTVSNNQHPIFIKIEDTSRDSGYYSVVKTTGFLKDGHKQVLYFGKPQIIAPPEPPQRSCVMSDDIERDAMRYRWLKSRRMLNLQTDCMTWIDNDGNRFIAGYYLVSNNIQHSPIKGFDETIDNAIGIDP